MTTQLICSPIKIVGTNAGALYTGVDRLIIGVVEEEVKLSQTDTKEEKAAARAQRMEERAALKAQRQEERAAAKANRVRLFD